MAHYDVYRGRLATTYPALGHALWEPGPEGQHGPVEVGDVGYIRQGKFHRLFNALLPADHPSHRGIPLPEHHEPLTPNVLDHIDRGTLKPDHYCSTGVTAETEREDVRAATPDDVPQVSFSCANRRGGAVLSLPVDAQRQDTRSRGDFGKWMLKNIDSWFYFARGLGLGIEHMEEIVLVTGLHLTKSWATVAFFEGQSNAQASFGSRVVPGADVRINWRCLPGSVRGGMRSWGPEGNNLEENQCVLVRGFRVARVLGILPRRLRGAAGQNPSLEEDDDDDEPDKELISIGSVKYQDPLHVLIEYIREHANDCDMVVVHDDDLARIQGDYQPDALMSHLQSTKPVIHRVLCDCPSTNEGKSTTVTVTAATLSDAFQKRVPRALSASPVRALRLGVKRPGYGKAGRRIRVYSNLVEAKLRVNQGILHHYDVAILPSDENRSIAQNHQIIDALQTQVEGRLSVQPGVYDGRKNLFTSFDLELESGCRKYVVPVDIPSLVKGDTPTQKFSVCLTHVASIDPEVLNRFVRGEQGHDNVVLTAMMALNVVVRMGPSMKYPFNNRSFFTGQEIRPIGGGIVLWRGYFQSLRPAIDRMLINVNTSTSAMYRPGKLMDLALEFLNKPGRPDALEPRHGLLDDERLRLQEFVLGIRVIAPPRTSDPDPKRLIQKLTRQSSRERKFNIGDGQIMTVAQYFQDLLNIPLQYPDVICVELSTHAIIPLELCEVLPGQLARKQMSPDKTRSMLDFSTMHPRERMRSIRDGIGVLQYGQSEYVRQFGMAVSNELVGLDGRIIKPPTLKYNPESGRSSVQPRNGTWNLIDKYMFRPAEIPNWIVLIYENEQRFGQQAASQVITDLVRACEAVGITTNPLPAVVKWESGQGNVGHQLRAACDECQQITKAPPTLIAVILPDGGTDIYTAVKHFGDVSAGIATQCMKASKCFNAGPQYYASLTLKINVKLGGTNAVPEPKDVSFLTDPTNPTIVMGAHITHPPLESQDRPSFTSIIGSVDSSGVRYVSRMGVQASRRVVIEDMENMCVHVFEQFRDAMNKFPKRILFYRDGVPEGEFKTIINEELLLIRNACTKLGFNPAITLIIVGKGHKIVFFPDSARDADRSANCPPGMVVDTGVVSPAEFDYFLYGHAGLLGTSKPAHYTVLIDENEFTPDDLQSISFALCHLYARCTRSISVPAPVYYARNVCTRAKTHYDPQQRRRLFEPDTATETTDAPGSETTKDISGELREGFQQTHERMAKMMYFC